jgi:hypothetical protein
MEFGFFAAWLLARQSLDPTASCSDDVFFPLAHAFFLYVDHERLAGNINFQDNFPNVLLERGRSWENPPAPAPADLEQTCVMVSAYLAHNAAGRRCPSTVTHKLRNATVEPDARGAIMLQN